jgi:molecular chaperone GrpE
MKDEEKDIQQNEDATKPEDTATAPPVDDELAALRKERDEYLQGWQRARADFSNYKKQEVDRLAEALRYSAEEIIGDLIRVLDSFDIGLATLEKDGKAEKGMYMIRAQLEDALKRRGLERIVLKPGDPFDPAVAESIGEVAGTAAPPGTIAEEIEAGYRLLGKVIRAARVRLAKQ